MSDVALDPPTVSELFRKLNSIESTFTLSLREMVSQGVYNVEVGGIRSDLSELQTDLASFKAASTADRDRDREKATATEASIRRELQEYKDAQNLRDTTHERERNEAAARTRLMVIGIIASPVAGAVAGFIFGGGLAR